MASTLKIRNIDFQFPDDMAWNWNPGNPAWGNTGHFISFMAPGFERYFIKAIRLAIPHIKDPAIAEEADLFCKQEGQHARHHQAHIAMLSRKYPGLRQVMDDVTRSYDELYRREPIAFHLAYAAVVEATFAPVAKFVIGNRDYLFKDTDPRMASFIIWHLMEEYEHRSSALNIYNAVVGSYWYRLRMAPRVVKHLMTTVEMVARECNACVPVAEQGTPMNHADGQFMNDVPFWNKMSTLWDLLLTVLPFHNPDHVKQPEWVKRWFEAENNGVDMRTYYPLVSR